MRKHIAKVRSIFPSLLSIDDLIGKKAYCGISLCNPNYTGKRLKAVLRFLVENLSEPLLLTGGYLYRHNFRPGYSNYEEATMEAEEKELTYLQHELLPAIDELRFADCFKIARWSEYYNTTLYKNSYTEVNAYYAENLKF